MLELIRRHRPSPAMIVAMVALVATFGGSAVANQAVDFAKRAKLINGSKIKPRTIRGNRLKRNTLGGIQINESKLAVVPNANKANRATDATNATNATNANNATAAGLLSGGDAKNLVSGYATVTAGVGPVVKNSGGKRVTSVDVSRIGAGTYDVTFRGSFPTVTTIDQVATFAEVWNSETFDQTGVSNDQSSASSSTITIRVLVWSDATGPNTLVDRDFTVGFFSP